MEKIVAYHDMPKNIWDILKNNNLFVIPWADNEERYTIKPFLDIELENNSIIAFLDKNILSYITGIVDEDNSIIGNQKSLEIACAVMYFLIKNNIRADPSIACHEYAITNESNKIANKCLRLFRIADNANPDLYLQILNEKKYNHEILKGKFNDFEDYNFISRLNDFDRNYFIMLKISEISLADSFKNEIERFKAFCDWMVNDYAVSGNALLFSLIYFSPAKFGKMIKNRRKADLRIDGIKNAAWDLCYLTYLMKHIKNDSKYYMLITNDTKLTDLGNLMYGSNYNGKEIPNTAEKTLKKFWGKQYKNAITIYKDLNTMINSEDRTTLLNQKLIVDANEINNLEKKL
jgi:hypothetical protein